MIQIKWQNKQGQFWKTPVSIRWGPSQDAPLNLIIYYTAKTIPTL